MQTLTSRCCTAARFVHLILLSIVILHGLAAAVSAQEKVIQISYGKLVDGRQLTHSGQPVEAIVAELRKSPRSELPLDDVEARMDSWEKRRVVLERKRQAYNKKVAALRARAQGAGSVEGLVAVLTQKDALQTERAWLEEETASLSSEFDALKPQIKALEAYRLQSSLRSQVEPFLEPFSFLLNDALATSDRDVAQHPLIDVGTLFPEGEPQPAWADLVRTRRYHVLSDGAGFVRLFIPGKDPQQAYVEHYGVLRHVLNWLLRSSQPSTLMRVEVYAYENDLTAETLTLRTTSHKFDFSAPLPPAKDTVPLDLTSLERFLASRWMFEGAYTNEKGGLVLYGSDRPQKPTLEGQPITLADLAVAYRAVFYSGHGEAYISLDPSPYPEQVNVNFGGRLADTRIGWVVLRSDMRFKTLSDDLDPETGVRRAAELRQKMAGFFTQEERYNSYPPNKRPSLESTRFWFYPESITLSQSTDGNFMRVSSPRFTGAAERQDVPSGNKAAPWMTQTLAHLNRNYSAFANTFPELRELDNVGGLLALFTWLRQRRSEGATLDLDALLNVDLPKCTTPRRRTQMIVGYLRNSGRIEPIDFSWIAEELASRRPRTGYGAKGLAAASSRSEDQADIDDRVWALLRTVALQDERPGTTPGRFIIAGGIDLGMRDVVKKLKQLSIPDRTLYSKLKTSAPEMRVPMPSKVFARSDARPPGLMEPYRLPIAKRHRIVTSELPPDPSMGREVGSNYQMLAYKTEGKTSWVRLAERNSLGAGLSKTVHVNNEGVAVAFTRSDGVTRQHYRLTKTGNNLVAEEAIPSPRTVEDAQIVNTALGRQESPTQAWRHLPEDTRIAAIETTKDGRVAILEDYGDSNLKLTYYKTGKPEETLSGQRAYKSMEDIARDNIATVEGSGGGGGGGSSKLNFMHASDDGDNIRIIIGKRKKDVPRSDMEEFLNNPTGERSKVLDDVFKPEGTVTEDFVIYRDALTRRPERFGGSLKAGRADDPVRLAVALRQRYKNTKIYLDDEVDLAAKNQQALTPLRRPADLGVLAPEESFAVTDHDLLKKIKEQLNGSGIRVFSTGQEIGTVPNVILISGHNDANLVTYLTSLGEQNLLKDKVLILNTCYAVDNPNLAHDLIQKYGARGIYLHTETIRPVALQPVMNQIGTLLQEAARDGKGIHPGELLDRAVDRVVVDDSLSPRLKKEVLKLKRGVLQISELRMPGVAMHVSDED